MKSYLHSQISHLLLWIASESKSFLKPPTLSKLSMRGCIRTTPKNLCGTRAANGRLKKKQAGELVIRNLLKGGRGHFGPLEHPQIVLNCGFFPHSTMQQIRTHRVGLSFDVQCLAGDTEVTFVHASGGLKKYKIAELYDLWSNGERAVRERKVVGRNGEPPGQYRRDCKKRLKKMRLRVLNEDTGFFEVSHLNDVMCSGQQPVYRLTLEDGKTLDCTANHRLFTAEGWQHMGDAVGLVADENHKVLATTRHCEVMCNGVLRPDALYTHKAWMKAQVQKGLHAQAIAQNCNASPDVVRYWAKKHALDLPSGYRKGLKTVAGKGIYRQEAWLKAQLEQGQNALQMAAWTRQIAPQVHKKFDYICQKCGRARRRSARSSSSTCFRKR